MYTTGAIIGTVMFMLAICEASSWLQNRYRKARGETNPNNNPRPDDRVGTVSHDPSTQGD